MSVKVEMSAKDARLFKKDVSRFLKIKDSQTERALRATALQIRYDAIVNLDQHKTTDRGLLKNSIAISDISTKQYKAKRIATKTGYGKWVEFGRPPGGMPPVDLIRGWVRRKLRISDDTEIKSVAYLIGRAIAKRGTKAQPFLGPAYLKNKRTLAKAIKKAYKQL